MVHTVEAAVRTRGPGDAVDVTSEVAAAVAASGVTSGIVTVFVGGSTAGVTTIEFEPGVVADLDRALEQVAPRQGHYEHHLRWGDDNGSAHVRAGIVGPSLTVPFRNGHLLLGTWQQIALLEFDTRPRTRQYIIQIVGDREET
jgi:secondary thiamine-phosphate synthase enzyme